jgi:hypothetical protein
MPGALLQLVGKGAQDQLVTGNPTFTNFRTVYKRHTDFAIEHFRVYFKTSQLTYPTVGTLTLRAKMEKYAQLLNDCYLSIDMPDIYSPVVPVTPPSGSSLNGDSDAIGYEFQWISNLGYNMIRNVSVLINGQEIVRHTGEWMKLYANLTFDPNKKAIVDRMIGNVPEMYDPANAGDRMNQYPHSISSATINAEPSIRGRTLLIPLHFWFCETVGHALPLVALQQSDVEIVVELRNMYDLFTIRDVRSSSSTFGTRIAPDASDSNFTMTHFLSPPLYASPQSNVVNLTSWNLNTFIEASYIFVSDVELAYLARTDHSFIFPQIDMVTAEGQYGPANDIELTMKNLCTRIVFVSQRDDRMLANDFDNYTNWVSALSPYSPSGLGWYTSGLSQPANVSARDLLLESTLILDGQERFAPKQTGFFDGLQMYRHQSGNPMPGIYEYSFALDNDPSQPSGSLNGSMFNKTILRNTYILPPYTSAAQGINPVTGQPIGLICVLKSTAFSPNPVIVNPNATDAYGRLIYKPGEVVTILNKNVVSNQVFQYTYNTRVYVQSYNFLRIIGGISNVVFSS